MILLQCEVLIDGHYVQNKRCTPMEVLIKDFKSHTNVLLLKIFLLNNGGSLPFTDAVLVQLYKIASSPNAVHMLIDVRILLFCKTSRFPSITKRQNKRTL